MELPFSFPFINAALQQKAAAGFKRKNGSEAILVLDVFVFAVFTFVFAVFAAAGMFVFVFAITGVFAPAIPRVIPLDQLE